MRIRHHALLLAFSCICFAQRASTALDATVESKIGNFGGKVSLYAKNLQTGETYSLRGGEPVRTASTIKLAILVECFFEAAEGRLKWNEPITITKEEQVSGSGVLQDFTPGVSLPMKDIVDLMIVMSDNTATNLILNRIGGDAVNERMEKLGFAQTRCMRKILGDGNKLSPQVSGVTKEGAKPENARWGIGRSSPREMATILEQIYRGELVDKEACGEMLEILKRQRDHSGILRNMKNVTVANKAGALDHLRSDVGIAYLPQGALAMAFTIEDMPEVNWTPDNPGELLISSLSEIVAKSLSPTAAAK
jgi:beta-lactamase class A